MNDPYSLWQDIQFDVAQGSILASVLFKIFLRDVFFKLNTTEIANHANVTTLYVVSDNINNLVLSMEKFKKRSA